MADNSFNANVGSLFQGMEGFITGKTVVGDAVKFDDGTIILPLVDVSFGVAAGAGKIQPSAILVIRNGETKLVNVKNQDSITKVLDMVPDLLDKYVPSKKEKAQKAKN